MLSDSVSPLSTNTVISIPSTFVSLEIFLGKISHHFQILTDQVSSALQVPKVQPRNTQLDIPLIKASTRFVAPDNATFAGRTVLCVGGQKNLYPAYRQIVEDAMGKFSSFHGSYNASLTELHMLLQKSSFIICPIDCVRHEAFLLTKRHCNQFCKPCVMLDKSRVTTFYNGIRMLKTLQ